MGRDLWRRYVEGTLERGTAGHRGCEGDMGKCVCVGVLPWEEGRREGKTGRASVKGDK